jgi:transcriptional regulator with XRE-family HTH domain
MTDTPRTRKKPALVPSKPALPETLALRVQYLRESLHLTSGALADKALVSESLIEDIESGLELFLAPSVRQKIARALRVRTVVLSEVEKPPALSVKPPTLPEDSNFQLLETIYQQPDRTYFCPLCGAKLMVKVFPRRDIYNNPVKALKINCSQCLFKTSFD